MIVSNLCNMMNIFNNCVKQFMLQIAITARDNGGTGSQAHVSPSVFKPWLHVGGKFVVIYGFI